MKQVVKRRGEIEKKWKRKDFILKFVQLKMFAKN